MKKTGLIIIALCFLIMCFGCENSAVLAEEQTFSSSGSTGIVEGPVDVETTEQPAQPQREAFDIDKDITAYENEFIRFEIPNGWGVPKDDVFLETDTIIPENFEQDGSNITIKTTETNGRANAGFYTEEILELLISEQFSQDATVTLNEFMPIEDTALKIQYSATVDGVDVEYFHYMMFFSDAVVDIIYAAEDNSEEYVKIFDEIINSIEYK